MRKCFIALVSAVALLMSGCVKDTTNDINTGNEVACTVSASIEGMTRTSMNDFEVGEKAHVVWSSGDKIGVVTAEGTIRQATVKASSVGKPDGEFDVTGAVAGETYVCAFYPYQNTVTYAEGSLKGLRLNAERKFTANPNTNSALLPENGMTVETNELPMVAKAPVNGHFEFKSVCGIVELQLHAKDVIFYNFTIHSSSKEISDYGTVDMSADEPVFTPYHMAKYDYNLIANKQYGTHSAYMLGSRNNSNGIKLTEDAVTKLYFVLPVGVYDDLQIHAACPSLAVTKDATSSHEIKRNTILAFKPINFSEVHNIYGGDDVVDLSANGVGYTYLAPTSDQPKKYKFKAVMCGDTKEFQLPDGTLINPSATTGKTSTNQNYNTTWVYGEDTKGVITNLRRQGDYIYFTASKAGNAIISIGTTGLVRFNQFHVWVSDAKDQTLPGGHTFLDRNLGATYAPATLEEAKAMTREQIWRAGGCLYQWGNPTPRPSMTPTFVPETFSSLAAAGESDFKTKGWNLYPWAVDPYSIRFFSSTTNTADLYRSRMYFNFYCVVTNSYADTGTLVWWQADKDKWGDLRFGDNALWQSTKTQFDPCPVGYRVPSRTELVDAFTNNGTHPTKQYKIAPGSAGQYYTYNDQFVFVSWSGLRKPTDGSLFNYAFGNYPRMGWWFFDDSLTDTEDMLSKYNNATGFYFYINGSTQNTGAIDVGKNACYPAVELRIGGNNWWVNNSNTDNNVAAPSTNTSRYPVNLSMGLRCVKIQ